MTTASLARATVALSLILGGLAIAGAQTPGMSPSDLGTRLREGYDIVALSQGVALVPRLSGGVRMIQVVNGVISVDGEIVTGQQLRDRLGPDADLVLQVSYLDADAQRQLSGVPPSQPSEGQTESPSPLDIERSEVREGDIIRFGGDVRIDRDERVQGDVVVFGGSADVDGEISGDLVVIGGTVRLGPRSIVRDDLNVIGGRLDRAVGARVLGDFNEVGTGRGSDLPNFSGARRDLIPGLFGSFWSRMGSLVATAMRLVVVLLIGLVAVAFGSGPIERIAARAAVSPLRSGLIGIVAEILFTPVLILVVVVLAVSIVGIPLLALVPFAILLLMILMFVGFVGLSFQVGQLVMNRLGRDRLGRADGNKYATVAVGVLAIGSVTLLAKLAALAGGFMVGVPLVALGYAVEYIAWTVGFGAAILAWYESQSRFGSRGHAMTSQTEGSTSSM